MGDLLTPLLPMFAGAALALGGFALGQFTERRRWKAWITPRRARVASIYGGWVEGRFLWRDPVPPSEESGVRKSGNGAPDA